MSAYCDIIIPTYNNANFLLPCVGSIIRTGVLDWMGKLIIVNNGTEPLAEHFSKINNILVVQSPDKVNLGWERGLALGLQYSDSPFVVFQNDDTLVPASAHLAYNRMLSHFSDSRVGAVGPSTTVAMGAQSIFNMDFPISLTEVKFLIFFCVMMRRDYLDQVGGIDTSLPGGDDLDLSIRLRKAGKKLIFDPFSFVLHHGFKTGERVEGAPNTRNGWNSIEKLERTNWALMQKHGINTFLDLWKPFPPVSSEFKEDTEGDICREYVSGDSVLEVGCGSQKTVSSSIGLDRVAYGDQIPAMEGRSVADIIGDAEDPLPFPSLTQDTVIARHILEHCTDILGTLRNWNRVLRMGGRLIVAVPDDAIRNGVPLNPEHKHSFTKESIQKLMKSCGFIQVVSKDPQNFSSFVSVFEKKTHYENEQVRPLEVVS